MSVRDIIRKLIYRERADSDSYIAFLRKKGIAIGKGCTIYFLRNTTIDYQNPHMLTLGNYVRIADGVKILTHDYSLSVMASYNGDIVGSVQKVVLKNNIFIGMNSIILCGVTIEDNVIIGAGSVVTKDCEKDSVYAGNPARRICSIEELYKKRKQQELILAKECAKEYVERTGKLPDRQVMREFSMLFTTGKEIPHELKDLMVDTGDFQKSLNYYENKKSFINLNDFLSQCGIEK